MKQWLMALVASLLVREPENFEREQLMSCAGVPGVDIPVVPVPVPAAMPTYQVTMSKLKVVDIFVSLQVTEDWAAASEPVDWAAQSAPAAGDGQPAATWGGSTWD